MASIAAVTGCSIDYHPTNTFTVVFNCRYPRWLESQKMMVPCGKCNVCRRNRSRSWAVRCFHEASLHESNVFVTLTYAQPPWRFEKRDFQLFMKRLRFNSGKKDIRYFAVAERGETYGRIHWHALLFGLGPDDRMLIEESWRHGLVHVGAVTIKSCRYVSNYLQKSDDSLRLMSKGIGKRFAEKNERALREHLKLTVEGVPYAIPRYYVDHLGIDVSGLADVAHQRNAKFLKDIVKRGHTHDSPIINKFIEQHAQNLQDKQNIKALRTNRF